MTLQSNRPRFAAAIIERSDNHMLVALPHEAQDVRKWIFPRGMVERNESPEAAVLRIARVQLNLFVELVVGQPPFLCEIEGQASEVRYFFCGIAGGQASTGPYLEIRWVHKSHLREYDFDEASRPVVEWLLEP